MIRNILERNVLERVSQMGKKNVLAQDRTLDLEMGSPELTTGPSECDLIIER